MRVALTIAGSDPGGGAGLQADLKSFAALRVYGTSAVTAVTVQNTLGVTRTVPLAPSLVAEQIAGVLADFPIAAAKTGMLASGEIVAAVARALPEDIPLVIDPVLASTGGVALLDEAGRQALLELLLPRATVVTPNLPEAELLTGKKDPKDAARVLFAMGARLVVVKGGHGAGDRVVDLVYDGSDFLEMGGPRIDSRSTHGTGCTHSAAIAAGLASGMSPLDAVTRARRFLEAALASAGPLGQGHGPLHHLYPYYPWKDAS